MESDATVVLRHGGLATARKPSRTSRTESTAVFVGRASFQMVPAQRKYGRGDDDVTAGAELRPVVQETQQEVFEALRAEARALRAESELRVAAAAAAANAALRTPAPGPTVIVSTDFSPPEASAVAEVAPQRRGVVAQVRPQVDVTEPIDARARSRSAARGRRGGVTPRTVVLALVAGASITLSAEAVMQQRPSTTAPAAAAVVAPRIQMPAAPIQAAVASPTPPPPNPTVVASTATAAQPQSAVELPPLVATPRRRLRGPRPSVAPSHAAATTPDGRRHGRAAWVDPFADPAPGKMATTKSSAKAWVDPFVD